MKMKFIFILTLLMSGRAMTLAFIQRAGGNMPGDPPAAWLLPLIGDAIIGISALWIAYLLLKQTGLWVWTVIVAWNALSIWDSLSAFVVSTTNPWPEFFMLQMFGSSMFFAAAAMNVIALYLLSQRDMVDRILSHTQHGYPPSHTARPH